MIRMVKSAAVRVGPVFHDSRLLNCPTLTPNTEILICTDPIKAEDVEEYLDAHPIFLSRYIDRNPHMLTSYVVDNVDKVTVKQWYEKVRKPAPSKNPDFS